MNITITQKEPATVKLLSKDRKKQLQGSLPCCNHLHLLSLLFLLPLLSHPSFLSFHPLIPVLWPFLSSVLTLLSTILTLLFSSIMDSLEISASCSGPCTPGSSQAVLTPTAEESSRPIRFRFFHYTSPWGVSPCYPVLLYLSCPVKHDYKSNW